jgi:TonB family protein
MRKSSTTLFLLSIILVAVLPSQAQRRRSRRQIEKPEVKTSQIVSKNCISDEETEGCMIDPSAPEPEALKSLGKIRCSDCIISGKALTKPAPCYPQLAKVAHISGEIQVKIVVDEKGKIIWARALSGHLLLRQAAVRAACHARFSPSYVSENKVKLKTVGVITYNFKLP